MAELQNKTRHCFGIFRLKTKIKPRPSTDMKDNE
jgi:hypothetical protein